MDIARDICTDSFYIVNSGLPCIAVTAVGTWFLKPLIVTFSEPMTVSKKYQEMSLRGDRELEREANVRTKKCQEKKNAIFQFW